jgi:serine/threonine-protein kinase
MECPTCLAENNDSSRFCAACGAPLGKGAGAGEGPEAASLTKTLETPVRALKPGTLVAGKYRIVEELGRGGMGVVYKAEDIQLQRTVALKFLPPELVHIPEIRDRFRQEAKAAAALDHPHICTIYDFDQDEDRAFISMAYIEGRSLRERIGSGPLELEEALKIAAQVAEGLEEAHGKGIVHRDIKSANIMVTTRGQAKIMDFGLARIVGATLVTQEGTTMGTVSYMSPEQARGEKVDHRTDIWSFGVVLYEMLTGELPFKGEQSQAVVYAILKEKPKPLTSSKPDLPPAIEEVVLKALEKDPDRRYQSFGELLDDLRSITAGIVPDEIKARLRRAKIARRKRALLYPNAAAVVIVAVVVLLVLTRRAETIGSVAVLPLENLTGDAEKGYYVDGVTDELIGHISRISGLRRVISRTSMMLFKGSDKTVPEIARELGVDVVVEGAVYRAGADVRLRLQLIDALPEERSLWTETYERPGADVLMMYGEIARTIADKLQIELTAEEEARFAKPRQVDPEAYALYLQGISNYYKLTPPDLDAAQKYFESALKKDPNYALAYLGMSSVFRGRAQMGLAPLQELRSEARRYLLKAMELDNSSAEAHFAMASLKTWHEWDWTGAEASFRRAIELNPNYAMARVFYSNLLALLDRPEEAVEQGRRALESDPINPFIKGIYCLTLGNLGRYDEAIIQARSLLKASPDNPSAHSILWEGLHLKEELDEALEEAKAVYTHIGLASVVESMSVGHETGGYSGAVRAGAEALIALLPEGYSLPLDIANFYAMAGDKDRTVEWLEKGYEIRDPNMPYFGGEGIVKSLLRDDPRYQDLLRRMNLPVAGRK